MVVQTGLVPRGTASHAKNAAKVQVTISWSIGSSKTRRPHRMNPPGDRESTAHKAPRTTVGPRGRVSLILIARASAASRRRNLFEFVKTAVNRGSLIVVHGRNAFKLGPLRFLAALLPAVATAACATIACRPDAPAPEAPHCCAERPRAPSEIPTRRDRLTIEPRVLQPPMPLVRRAHPRLNFPDHGTIAVGSAVDGMLIDGVELPPLGPHHEILAAVLPRRTNFGTDELVQLLTDSAAFVARQHPGAVLHVGNLARPGGGRLPWSVSHRNGLDADIGFYLSDSQGRQITPEHFVQIDSELRCVELADCHLDVPRTWSAVQALVAHPRATVQWLFVARHISDALLDHGREHGASPGDLMRAALLMHQPRGSSPHDNHLHIRIHCPTEDLLEGCRNIGIPRSGAPDPGADFAKRVAQLARLLRSEDPGHRAGAAQILALLDPDRVAGLGQSTERDRALIRLLGDPAEGVRRASAEALGRLRTRTAVPAIAAALQRERSAQQRHELLEALSRIGGAAAARALIQALYDERPTQRPAPVNLPESTVGMRAAYLLGRSERGGVVRPLITALTRATKGAGASPSASPAELRRALRNLTNHAFEQDDEFAAESWREWWRTNGRAPRRRWIEAGFEAAGHFRGRGRTAEIRRLLAAVRDEQPFVSYNARRDLSRLSGRDPGSEGWSRADAFFYWSRWCSRHYGEKLCRQ